MEGYKILTINSQQYNSPNLEWIVDGDINSATLVFLRGCLKRYLEDIKGKMVLDIGSGIGPLFPMLLELGASEVQGIEPSIRNAEYSRMLYPKVNIYNGTLETFKSEKKFHVVIAMLVFEHVLNLDAAFSCVSKAIKTEGMFYLICGNRDFYVLNRPGAQVDVQDLGNGAVATKTIRPIGPMYDIFRPLESIVLAAKNAGLILQKIRV